MHAPEVREPAIKALACSIAGAGAGEETPCCCHSCCTSCHTHHIMSHKHIPQNITHINTARRIITARVVTASFHTLKPPMHLSAPPTALPRERGCATAHCTKGQRTHGQRYRPTPFQDTIVHTCVPCGLRQGCYQRLKSASKGRCRSFYRCSSCHRCSSIMPFEL